MAKSKGGLTALIVIIAAIALLYVLNPSTEDFQAWRATQASGQGSGESGGLAGVFKKGAGAVVGAISGLYQRKDYVLCSTYSLGGDLYLGAARLFFKLK
jgi:hypothetical protein